MEDVLEVYVRPYDAARPVVCFDETSKQLLEHTRTPLPARPGDLAHVDDEYKRCGTANIFAAVEPLTGWCLVQATHQRTNLDTARYLRRLADEAFPKATAIALVMDNLSTHALSCLYEAFPPAEARRLTERFEVHHTPKHGSWLNIAEILLSSLGRQCLDQRIGTIAELTGHLAVWSRARVTGKVKWQFTTADARVRLHRLYPSLP